MESRFNNPVRGLGFPKTQKNLQTSQKRTFNVTKETTYDSNL